MSTSERSLRGRINAHKRWAHEDPVAGTAAARSAFLQKFVDQVDPDRVLSADERERRATSARRAYFAEMALKSARARRKAS